MSLRAQSPFPSLSRTLVLHMAQHGGPTAVAWSYSQVVDPESTGYCLFCQERAALTSHSLVWWSATECWVNCWMLGWWFMDYASGLLNVVSCYCGPHIGCQVFMVFYHSDTGPTELRQDNQVIFVDFIYWLPLSRSMDLWTPPSSHMYTLRQPGDHHQRWHPRVPPFCTAMKRGRSGHKEHKGSDWLFQKTVLVGRAKVQMSGKQPDAS